MKIRKFFAGSSREALRMVREALGPDAVVLSNRALDGGVELVALAENDLASLAHPNEPARGLPGAQAMQPVQPVHPDPWAVAASQQYEQTQQPQAHPNRALPDPFASTFGAPAALVDPATYGYGAPAHHDAPAVLPPPVAAGRARETRDMRYGSQDHEAPRFGADANPALERVVERAVERSLRQQSAAAEAGHAAPGAPTRFQAPDLGRADHVVRSEPPMLTPSAAMARKLGTAGERITPVSALPGEPQLSAPLTPPPASPSAADQAQRHAAAQVEAHEAHASARRVDQGLPASVSDFAVPPVRASVPPAGVTPSPAFAQPAGAMGAPAPQSEPLPAAQHKAAYSMRTTVSASLGMPFNLGTPAAAPAALPENVTAAAPAAAPLATAAPANAPQADATDAPPAVAAPAVAAQAAPLGGQATAGHEQTAAVESTGAPVAPGPAAGTAAPQPAAAPSAPRDLAAQIAAVPVEEAQMRVAEMVAQNVIGEIHSMRGLLEEQLASLLWSDRQRREPVRGQAAKSLLAAGFSAQLVKLLIERMPTQTDHAQAMEWLKAALERNLPVLQSEDALLERGGVYALMGPTGVGKTTTTAKLAARCVMRYGADRVALLTTDSYRIGAHEQLRIYGKILGVGVHAVKDAADLRLALSELRNKHMVLIDTIGMSQRDRTVSEQVAMLCGTGMPVQRLLLLNATSHGDTLNEVVHAYRNRQAEGHPDLAGCILTKLDEATNIGAVLDTVIRYRLPVHYVSTGQKVPENLYVARKEFLMKSAFCVSRENSPFVPAEEDLASVMASVPARSSAELSEVRLG